MTNEDQSQQATEKARPLDVDFFLMRHGVFVRGARDAARQALFFLDLLLPCDRASYQEAIAAHWEPALHQAKGLVLGVHVPDTYEWAEEAPEGKADARVARACNLARSWNRFVLDVETAAGTDTYSLPLLAAARASLKEFLKASRVEAEDRRAGTVAEMLARDDLPEFSNRLGRRLRSADAWVVRLTRHSLPNFFSWLGRRLSLILAVALVLWVCLGVEAVGGLLRNAPLKLLLYVFLLPLPAYVHLLRLRRLLSDRTEPVHQWDIGRLPFWRLRPLAKTPRRLIPRWPDRSPLLGKIRRAQTLRMVTYLVGAAIAVAILYFMSGSSPPTVPIILWIFYAILLVADQLDLWDFLLPEPVRVNFLLMIGLALAGLRLGLGHKAFTILFFSVTVIVLTLYIIGHRRWGYAVVIASVCAAFGVLLLVGLYTNEARNWRRLPEAPTFQRLQESEWPYGSPGDPPVVVMAASGGGSRAAVYTALTITQLELDFPEIAGQLQLISSVSGGSLANAAYVARRSGCGSSEAPASLLAATKEDFLFPTLMGAVFPGKSRGETIEEAWRNGPTGLGCCSLADLAERWRSAKKSGVVAPPFPVPMFNTATLDGHDVVISPLSEENYIHQKQRRQALSADNPVLSEDPEELAADPLTWVFYRDGIYSLEDFLDRQDLRLSSAVLASANFPFGFPVVKLVLDPKKRDLIFSPSLKDPEMVKLTDGGALSNSGMWPLFQLLVNRSPELAPRGVLLIIVEASKMPSYRSISSTFNGLLGTMRDQGGIGRNLHERMLDILELHYAGRLATVQLDLIPRESYNVHTTWALDDRSVKRLELSFAHRWEERRGELSRKWHDLKDHVDDSDLIDRRRPPLD